MQSVHALALTDTPAEERFDRITRLARRSLGTPIALVTLVDGDRQWFKSNQGLDADETAREVSFCGHAILDLNAFVVGDAREDARFADNPLVVGPPYIRYYAGQPIRAASGQPVGTLCVIDSKPRTPGDDDLATLRDLAALVENELRIDALGAAEHQLREMLSQAERRASLDGLTHLWNHETILRLVDLELVRATRAQQPVSVAMLDIDHFKQINDEHGHPVGDEVIAEVSRRLRSALRPYDTLGRYGGEEFLALLVELHLNAALGVCERMRSRVAGSPIATSAGPLQVSVSIGVHSAPAVELPPLPTLVERADRALYAAKRAGRNRIESA